MVISNSTPSHSTWRAAGEGARSRKICHMQREPSAHAGHHLLRPGRLTSSIREVACRGRVRTGELISISFPPTSTRSTSAWGGGGRGVRSPFDCTHPVTLSSSFNPSPSPSPSLPVHSFPQPSIHPPPSLPVSMLNLTTSTSPSSSSAHLPAPDLDAETSMRSEVIQRVRRVMTN